MIQFNKRRIPLHECKELQDEVYGVKHTQYMFKQKICFQAVVKKHMYNQIFFSYNIK